MFGVTHTYINGLKRNNVNASLKRHLRLLMLQFLSIHLILQKYMAIPMHIVHHTALTIFIRESSATIFDTFCNYFSKNVNFFKFHYHIWNHRAKCIQLSTNMLSIGSIIRKQLLKFAFFYKLFVMATRQVLLSGIAKSCSESCGDITI